MNVSDALFSLPQYLLPQYTLSRLMHRITRCENNAFKNWFIQRFIHLYGVDMSEAQEPDPTAYPHFNAFFTRALKPGARPLSPDSNSLLCPADGAISQLGEISDDRVFQAKGKHFTVTELLGGNEDRALPFRDGKFATIYLSPRDYHRLHMPLTGTLREMIHVPGRLFSVNTATTNFVPGLFARNERVAAIFDTELGPMALVLVGAIFVASIETVWHGVVTPPTASSPRVFSYPEDHRPTLATGHEMGRFNMGSTIIVLFGADTVRWDENLNAASTVRMGTILGRRA